MGILEHWGFASALIGDYPRLARLTRRRFPR